MLEGNLQKKYDFFEFYSELKISKEHILNGKEPHNLIKTNSSLLKEELTQYNNNLKIEHSTFIIKAPNKIILIFSVNKDLPVKIEKGIFSIPISTPVLQAISFMHESKNESIIISTGDSLDNIEVFQIELKKLMHKASYNKLNLIKNALKIIPIKDSLALILHYSTHYYKNGGLKLWKNFEEEIYNFNKVYNFTYNFQYLKIICVDNKEAPFILSIYPFDESYFSKKTNEILNPEFFISLNQYLKNINENEIDFFLHLESFSNIICFWAKSKNILRGCLLGIFFIDFKAKKPCDYIEIIFEARNKYFFKANKISNELYIFDLSKELLYLFIFNKKDILSSSDLFICKIYFSGNIKGVDFTENNEMVILTEQNNLICYSKNERIFNNCKKEFKCNHFLMNNIINNSLNKEDILNFNNINKLFIKRDSNLDLNKQNSEKIKNININLENNDINKQERNNIIILNNKKQLNGKNNLVKKESETNEKKNFKNIIAFKLDSYTQTPKEVTNKKLKIDAFCQTEDKKRNTKEENENFEIKEDTNDIEDISNKENENESKIFEKMESLENRFKTLNENYKIEEKFKLTNNDKCLIIKILNLFKEMAEKLEDDYTKNIIKYELNIISRELDNRNIEINQKRILIDNNFYSDINLQLIKSKYYILNIKYILLDLKYIANKIIEKINNIDDIKYDEDNYNFNYESIELINKAILFELKNKKDIVGKMIYKCNYYDDKINFIAIENSNVVNIDNKYNYLFYYCLSIFNKLNKIYKYNKFKINKNQENELIYGLINLFAEFFNKIIKDYKLKVVKLYKEAKQLKIKKDSINKYKIHSLIENKYLNKFETENEKNEGIDSEGIISNYLEDIYKGNIFYSFKGDIITNKYINLDDEFKN